MLTRTQSYAGAIVCPGCGYWTAYGNFCHSPECNEKILAPETLLTGEAAHAAGFFHPPDGEDGLIGMCVIIGGLIVGGMLSAAVRGS
jgi:hypothetical protein